MESTSLNKAGAVLGLVLVGLGFFINPEFLQSEYVTPQAAFWLKWGVGAFGAVLTAYNGLKWNTKAATNRKLSGK